MLAFARAHSKNAGWHAKKRSWKKLIWKPKIVSGSHRFRVADEKCVEWQGRATYNREICRKRLCSRHGRPRERSEWSIDTFRTEWPAALPQGRQQNNKWMVKNSYNERLWDENERARWRWYGIAVGPEAIIVNIRILLLLLLLWFRWSWNSSAGNTSRLSCFLSMKNVSEHLYQYIDEINVHLFTREYVVVEYPLLQYCST